MQRLTSFKINILITQEKCQEDFLKLEQDFEQKKPELSRKIESSAKKLIDDTAKLKSDRDKRLEVNYFHNM